MITSNRDETPLRNASEVRRARSDGHTLVYPVDPGAGGSWIAISDQGSVGCLLNGAFVAFTPDPKYTHSRGQVLLSALTRSVDVPFHPELLLLTAPFTLVMRRAYDLTEYVWDGDALHTSVLDPAAPGFWSSVTLYPEDVRAWRRSLFGKWLENHPSYAQEDIMEFHRYGSPEDAWNGFVMNREERVRTLSITSVKCNTEEITLCHHDLLADQTINERLEVINHDVASD